MSRLFSLLVLDEIKVDYGQCLGCGYACTIEPHWLARAYSEPILAADTGLVSRNLAAARGLQKALPYIARDGVFVDWAGGTGLLVRLMRDAGFNFTWHDPYATNVLSRGFEWEPMPLQVRVNAVTAFEVLEHVWHPTEFIEEVFDATQADVLLFSQELFAGTLDPNWWYLTPQTGQHVSFFRRDTLMALARRLNLHFSSFGTLHVMAKSPLSHAARSRLRCWQFEEAVRRRLALSLRKPSLQFEDHKAALGVASGSGSK